MRCHWRKRKGEKKERKEDEKPFKDVAGTGNDLRSSVDPQ